MTGERCLNEEFGYSVWIPKITPRGQTVSVQINEQRGRHIIHAESPDQSELYFEILAHERIFDHGDLAREQQDFLTEQSENGEFTEILQETVHDREGTKFDFRGTLQNRWKVRRFLFIDGLSRTFRIFHDPTSELNVKVFKSLELFE